MMQCDSSIDARQLYFDMLRIRLVEETIASAYQEQEMRCPVHLSVGQEAAAVGVCAALSRDDYVLSGHRCHSHYLARGGNLKAMIAELFGKASGCCKGKGGSMHLVDLNAGFLGAAPIVGSTIAIAAGAALGSKMRGENRVTVVFFGDGATEEGVFHESLNFAALKKLPVIFVCENNLYSVYSPLSVRQPEGRPIAALAEVHGLQVFSGDGNDVLQVYKIARQAVADVRSGSGPVFMELATYRWLEHCGPNYDNDLGYRSKQEYLSWRKSCPLARLEESLLSGGTLDAGQLQAMRQTVALEIDEAFSFARMSPLPGQADLLTEVFAP